MDKQRRTTKTKQMVMSILENSNTALCHEEIEKRLSEKMDRVTIYRILQGFCDDGIVHKIINEEGVTYYALCHNCTREKHHDNHPHFHCISCDTITCIEMPVAEQPLPAGYNSIAFSSLIAGYCNKCSSISKTICLFLLLSASQIIGFAQTKITVLERESATPIVYANVYFPDMKTGGVTDSDGQFKVDFTFQKVLVQISAMGYQSFLDNIYMSDNPLIIYLEPSVHELQELVVSDHSSRLQGENVMNVEKLGIKNGVIQGVSLADKLTSIAGIDNLSTGAGIGKPVIRGLSGNRIAVFTQGMRLENQQWGDEHGLGLDENGYEQVEIIKGPASLLYGSDALGGVLYFIDERYSNNNSIESAFNSEYNSNALGFRNRGTFKLSKERLHLNLFGVYTTHADYKDGANNFVPNSRFKTGNMKSMLGYTGDKFTTSLKYSFLSEQYGLTENHEEDEHHEDEEIYTNGRHPTMPYQDLTTHIISSENTFFLDNGSTLKLDAGYIFNNRKEFEDEHHSEEAEAHNPKEAALSMNLNTFSYNAKWLSQQWKEHWTLTVGSQGMVQNNANDGEEILIPDANTLDFGVFTMTNFQYARRAYWQTGLRFDTRRISCVETWQETYYSFSFSTGIYQPLTEDLSFRANLSSGFRAPNMYELLSNGIHHGANRYETGNRDLKTENCYQIDAALNYHTKHLKLFVNPYFNFIRNYIYLQPTAQKIDNMQVYDYLQADAYLYGSEAGFHFHPHPLDWLHIESSYSTTFGREHNNYLALMPSQKLKTTVSAAFSCSKKVGEFSLYVQNQYSFAQNLVAAEETSTPAYQLFNAGIACNFEVKQQKIQLNLAVNNILNETYYDHLSRYKTDGIYNRGRNFNIKISIPLALKL